MGDGVSLGLGTYWISVQAVQNFNPNGQWFWHNRPFNRTPVLQQNPGDGYGTGPLSLEPKEPCMPDQVWPDQVFSHLSAALSQLRLPYPATKLDSDGNSSDSHSNANGYSDSHSDAHADRNSHTYSHSNPRYSNTHSYSKACTKSTTSP